MSEGDNDIYDLGGALRTNDVLLDKKGRIIDGFHRLAYDKNWKKQTLESIDTDVKFHAARIIANINRRTPSDAELHAWINNLAGAILAERGDIKNVSNTIRELTGLSKNVVNRQLDPKYKEYTPRVVVKKPESPKIPEKDSPDFGIKVQNIIATGMGHPIESIISRLCSVFKIEREEAIELIKAASQSTLATSWNMLYDSQWNLKIVKKELPEVTKPPTVDIPATNVVVYEPETKVIKPLETPEEPEYPTFETSLLYDHALEWYPKSVLDELWDRLPSDSVRKKFFPALIEELWKMSKRLENPEALTARIMKQLPA